MRLLFVNYSLRLSLAEIRVDHVSLWLLPKIECPLSSVNCAFSQNPFIVNFSALLTQILNLALSVQLPLKKLSRIGHFVEQTNVVYFSFSKSMKEIVRKLSSKLALVSISHRTSSFTLVCL